jgi:hypothetical protein
MKHALSYHDYRALCSFAEQKDENICKQYSSTMDALFTYWTKTLGHDKICVLGFVLSRTLKYGKAVAAIPFPAFLGGVVSEEYQRSITSALNISKNTLRNVLKELVEDGFLHAFFPEKRRGVVDNFTRFFEIDFKKLQRLTSKGSSIMGILRTPKSAKSPVAGRENSKENTPEKSVLRLPKLGGLSSIHKIPKGIYTASPAARGTGLEDEQPETNIEQPVPTVRRLTRTRPAAATPIATQPTPAPLSGVASLIQRVHQMQQEFRDRRAAKVRSAKGATSAALQQQQVQAMLDSAMAKYFPNSPRMAITGKAFGAMRNHLKRSAPEDLDDFINWTIRSWSELAQQHSRSARKNLGDSTKAKFEPLPFAPNFNSFGYRLPYFLACYVSRKAETAALGSRDTRQDELLERTKRALAHTRQEIVSLRAVAQKAQQEARERRSATTRIHETSYDNDIPAWDDSEENE